MLKFLQVLRILCHALALCVGMIRRRIFYLYNRIGMKTQIERLNGIYGGDMGNLEKLIADSQKEGKRGNGEGEKGKVISEKR
jgi:hypothetical protein